MLVPNVSVEVPFPPFDRTMDMGLILATGQPRARHEAGGVKSTVPLNPLMLVKRMVDLAVEPGCTV